MLARSLKFRLLACTLLWSCAATGIEQPSYITETNKTISRVGAQGTIFYVSFNEPLARTCQWGVVYIAQDRKGMYAQVLAAKLSGRKLSRIDYSQAGGDETTCNLELVEFIE